MWIVGLGRLSKRLGVDKRTLRLLSRRVNFFPYSTHREERAFLVAHLPLIVERIYFAENGLRPSTLARMFNSIVPDTQLTARDFRRVGRRWVLR